MAAGRSNVKRPFNARGAESMKRIDRKRLEALTKVQELAETLTKDLEIASEQLADAVKAFTPSDSINWDIAFSGKTGGLYTDGSAQGTFIHALAS
jgi:hypothetical protein